VKVINVTVKISKDQITELVKTFLSEKGLRVANSTSLSFKLIKMSRVSDGEEWEVEEFSHIEVDATLGD
jgi:hypothetical protein